MIFRPRRAQKAGSLTFFPLPSIRQPSHSLYNHHAHKMLTRRDEVYFSFTFTWHRRMQGVGNIKAYRLTYINAVVKALLAYTEKKSFMFTAEHHDESRWELVTSVPFHTAWTWTALIKKQVQPVVWHDLDRQLRSSSLVPKTQLCSGFHYHWNLFLN